MNTKNVIDQMFGKRLDNYVIPGLSSTLLEHGKIRVFEMSRAQDTAIVPHSHRYDFTACVLEGTVINTLYKHAALAQFGDKFQIATHQRDGELTVGGQDFFVRSNTTYKAGDWYTMAAHEVHDIVFSRGARVLLIEGPEITDTSTVLLPIGSDGRVCNTFIKHNWMYRHVQTTG